MPRFVRLIISIVLLVTLPLFAESANHKLLQALSNGKVSLAKQAFKEGANPNIVDDEWPIFISVINSGDKAMIRLFLEQKVDVNKKGPDGRSPMMHAIIAKDSQLIKDVMAHGAELDDKDAQGKTLLMYAASNGNVSLLKKLLSSGLDPAATSKEGKRALTYAIEKKQKGCVDVLGKIETLPVDFGNAVIDGDAQKVQRLLRDGASPNWKDRNGKPVIVTAIEKGHPLVAQHLIKAGVNLQKSYFKNRAVTLFDLAMHNKHTTVAELLLKYGAPADLNRRVSDGKTALMIAIEQNRKSFLRELMKRNFDVDRGDDYGKTALMFAAEKNNIFVVKQLLQKGADKSIRQMEGKTAFQIAKEKGFAIVANMLK
ncbi:ankyrin repeat domain-containing protein [bacterium]|nr:ankyrin repeat domain-containing protein [bacterium]